MLKFFGGTLNQNFCFFFGNMTQFLMNADELFQCANNRVYGQNRSSSLILGPKINYFFCCFFIIYLIFSSFNVMLDLLKIGCSLLGSFICFLQSFGFCRNIKLIFSLIL